MWRYEEKITPPHSSYFFKKIIFYWDIVFCKTETKNFNRLVKKKPSKNLDFKSLKNNLFSISIAKFRIIVKEYFNAATKTSVRLSLRAIVTSCF